MTIPEQSCGGSGMAASFGQMWMPEGVAETPREDTFGIRAQRKTERAETVRRLSRCLQNRNTEIIALRYRVGEAEHARAVAVATLSEQLDAANARVAEVEAQHAKTIEQLVSVAEGRLRNGERAEKAEARVATLEAECVAWRKAEDWMFWDIGEPNDFAVSQREMSEDQFRLDAARAATGPIGGVA